MINFLLGAGSRNSAVKHGGCYFGTPSASKYISLAPVLSLVTSNMFPKCPICLTARFCEDYVEVLHNKQSFKLINCILA